MMNFSSPPTEWQTCIRRDLEASIDLKASILGDDDLVAAIGQVAAGVVETLRRGNRVLLAGNGGSAADAQHIAAELVSRFLRDRPGLPAMALTTDTSMLTAIGNDYGFERVFERQLEANARPGDLFIGISTSGNSPNVLRAMSRCADLEVTRVGFTGRGGKLASLCQHVIAVPSDSTPRIQEAHITIGHIICGLAESTLFPGGS